MKEPVLTIVVPCYNEEEVLPTTIQELDHLLDRLIDQGKIASKSKLLFVDDGSKDRTWEIIQNHQSYNPHVSGLKLSRNVGHQNALLAGLFTAKESSDCVISIDADLQDDIEVIPEFVEKFKQGYDVVYGVRRKRETDTSFKRNTALAFYQVMRSLGVNLIYNHADYRLMSKRALEKLEHFGEINLFLRGIIPLIGFPSTQIFYDRKERFAGETKYPLKKMISFAIDGITSFSITPIRFVSVVGLLSFLISGLFGLYFLFLKFTGNTETGWTSIIISIWFLGGLQLMGLGLIGEYVGKIYKEVKRRPRYIIEMNTYSAKMKEEINQSETIKV